MPNKTTKPTSAQRAAKTSTVKIHGEEYKLGYDFNVIAEVEREAGCNLLHAINNIANLSSLQLRGLLCAAIRAGNPASKITVKEAGELIQFDTIFEISEAIAESIVLTLPEQPKPEPVQSEAAAV